MGWGDDEEDDVEEGDDVRELGENEGENEEEDDYSDGQENKSKWYLFYLFSFLSLIYFHFPYCIISFLSFFYTVIYIEFQYIISILIKIVGIKILFVFILLLF